jgi:NYN domain
MAGSPTRIAVFIDWQNAYKAAREAFGLRGLPNERGNFSPFKLARILAAGHGRSDIATRVRVEVHRGLPSSSRDPVGYGANRRQAAAWIKEGGSVVVARLRPLRYPPSRAADQTPVEKGIDVQLALAVAETILTNTADVAILFTHDTDLLPAVEMVARLKARAGLRRPRGAAIASPNGCARCRASTTIASVARCSSWSRHPSTTRTARPEKRRTGSSVLLTAS